MSFWSTVGKVALGTAKVAKGAAEKMAEQAREIEMLADEYRLEEDDFLKRKFKKGRKTEKMAAYRVLKERGYGNQKS